MMMEYLVFIIHYAALYKYFDIHQHKILCLPQHIYSHVLLKMVITLEPAKNASVVIDASCITGQTASKNIQMHFVILLLYEL